MKLWVCTTKSFLHKLSETVSGKLICMLVFLNRALTGLQFSVVTDLLQWENAHLRWPLARWRSVHINMTRSRRPLSCHSSTAITSCFSMIMHGPMVQGSVHKSWKLKMSQFIHGLHTQTCHPLSMFGMLWIDVYNHMFQFPPISSNFSDNIPQVTINSLIKSMRRRCRTA